VSGAANRSAPPVGTREALLDCLIDAGASDEPPPGSRLQLFHDQKRRQRYLSRAAVNSVMSIVLFPPELSPSMPIRLLMLVACAGAFSPIICQAGQDNSPLAPALDSSSDENKASSAGAASGTAGTNASHEGWVALFDGKSLVGWKNPYAWGKAEVVNGEIHLTANKKFFLVTQRDYSDFVFEGEILLPPGEANSGFMFRCHVEPNRVFGYQAEVDGSDRRWSGGLYDEGRRQWLWPSASGRTTEAKFLKHEADSKAFFAKPEIRDALHRSEWNKYRITCRGNEIKIEVNGVVTTEIKDDLDAKGPLGIQHHGEKGKTYRFRNLRVREL
jgi:hypothetical protein